MDLIVFYLFAGLAILAAIGVVAVRSAVYSALCLAVVFVSLAALYVLLSAPFIAAAQVMIYAGAILILFVFVIMMLSPGIDQGPGALKRQRPLAIVFGLALVAELVAVLAVAVMTPMRGMYSPETIAKIGGTQAVGALLFTDFLLPFEITSLLLLVAMIGVIVLAKKPKKS